MEHSKRSTTAQLRADIDSGRTGSKVSASDPAASPLGTDDEAAGTAASADRVEMARQAENKIGDAARKGSTNDAAVDDAQSQRNSHTPYAKEEHMNEELAKQKSGKVQEDPSEQPS